MLLSVGALIVVAYLVLSINVYLESQALGRFSIGYGLLGPTEVRLILIALNTALALGFGTRASTSFGTAHGARPGRRRDRRHDARAAARRARAAQPARAGARRAGGGPSCLRPAAAAAPAGAPRRACAPGVSAATLGAVQPARPLPRRIPLRLALAAAAVRGRRTWRDPAVRERARATAEAITGRGPHVDRVARAHLAATASREEMILRPWVNHGIPVYGTEHLDAARASGRGVIVTHCHHGPFAGYSGSIARLVPASTSSSGTGC